MTDTASRVEQWEQRTEWPLTCAAVVFLLAYAAPILAPDLSPGWQSACRVAVLVTWAAFGVDYLARLGLADNRWRYFWRHLLDLAVVALPVLRPLRLLRVVMLLRILNRSAAASLRGRIAIYVSSATGILLLCASLTVLDAERADPNANIHSFADALWWSTTTITTVGYGDHYPVTGQGRLVAAGLMLGGLALLGIVTATLASWLIDRIAASEESAQAATRDDLAELTEEVRQLRRQLAHLVAEPGAPV